MMFVRLIFVLLVLLSLTAGNLCASPKYKPAQKHYAAVQLREECSVRKAVLNKVKLERREKLEALGDIQQTLKERRQALEQCAASNGLVNWDNEDDELYLAQVCQESYDLWLTPGYHIEIVQREVFDLERSFEKLNNYLYANCSRR